MDISPILIAASALLGTATQEATKLAVADFWKGLKSLRGADSQAIMVLDEVHRQADSPASRELCMRIDALRLNDDDPAIADLLKLFESQLQQSNDPAIAALLKLFKSRSQQKSVTIKENHGKQVNFIDGVYKNTTVNL